MTNRRRPGLEVRLAAVTVIAVLVSGVLILAYNQRRVLPEVEGLRVNAVELSVNATTARIDALTARMERHVEGVARSGELLHALKHLVDAGEAATGLDAEVDWEREANDYLAQSAASFPEGFGNGFWFEPREWDPAQELAGFYAQVDDSEELAPHDVERPGYDYLSQPWYVAALGVDRPLPIRRTTDLVWTGVYLDEASGEAFQTVDAVMYDGERPIGVATTDWTLREMTELLAELKPTSGSRAFLVDPVSQTMVVNLGTGRQAVPLAESEVGSKLDLTAPAGSVSRQALEVDGVASEVFVRRSTSGLLVGLVVPTSDIAAPVEDIRDQVMIAIVAGVAMALLLGLLGVHGLLRPLTTLTRAVDAVAGGLLEVRVPEDGAGELGVLSRSFNRMTRELTRVTQRHDDKVTELEVAKRALGESERRHRTILETVSEGIIALDSVGDVSYLNPAAAGLLGDRSEALVGRPFVSFAVPDDQEALARLVNTAGDDDGREDHRFLRSDGTVRWSSVSARVGSLDGQDGVLLALRDVTERKSAEEQLRQLALYDPLTGLANRSLLRSQLDTHLARLERDRRNAFAVLFIDCDRFKLVNDAYGHLLGDELLLQVARRITAAVRPGDLVARFGGDEFVVIVEGIERPSEALVVARRVLVSVSGPCQVQGHDLDITASIGTVFIDQPGSIDADGVLREADIAMYEAKTQGRHRVVLYEPVMAEAPSSRLQMEAELRRALERDEITLRYQPIVAVADGKLLGFEALARWDHPSEGIIPPGRFIDVAEDSGLIVPLGWRVIEMACAAAAGWGGNGSRPFVAVNLSRRQLTEPMLADQIQEVLDTSGLDPARLHLEITESLAMQDVLAETGVLTDLKALGASVVIDDFGTGYSSLAALHRLPIDGLKIDRAFVRSIGGGGRQEQVVGTIVRLALELGVHSVAEGVETEAQWDGLRQLGCEAAQGYLLGLPLAPDGALARASES